MSAHAATPPDDPANPGLEQVIQEWIAQGRDAEQVHGVRNFFTGIGRSWLINQLSLAEDRGMNKGVEAALEALGEKEKQYKGTIPKLLKKHYWVNGYNCCYHQARSNIESLLQSGYGKTQKEANRKSVEEKS